MRQVPSSTAAGTTKSMTLHQSEHTVSGSSSISSGSHPSIQKVLATIRVPGLSARNFVPELREVIGQQKQCEDGGVGEIGGEHIAFNEGGALGDALLCSSAL